MRLTWARTKTEPETWNLGKLIDGHLLAVRAEVVVYPDGTWFWMRWDLSRYGHRCRNRCGDAGT